MRHYMDKYRVKVDELSSKCDKKCLNFKSTAEIEPLKGIMGQDRAVEAIEFALGMKKKGYNIYVSGSWGTGRNSYVNQLTYKEAKNQKAPKDWIYVNNFKNFRNPIAIGLETGEGKNFIRSMEFMIVFFKKEIQNVFSSKEYENTRAIILEEYSNETDKIILELNKIGRNYGFKFIQNEKGLISIPLKNGEAMNEEEYKNISDEEYEKLKEKSNELSLETVEYFNELRKSEENYRLRIKNLDEQMGRKVVSFHLMNIREKYKDNKNISLYFDYLTDDIVDHLDKFKGEEEEPENPALAMIAPKSKKIFFNRYKINLFVDNSEKKHAPVVFASNPSYYNILGSIEYRNEYGVMKTDFMQIKPGALHEANGGYLIVLAKDILTMPYAWKGIKRAMLDGKVSIESIGSQYGTVVSQTLKPQPIPLNVKVIVIGDAYTYQMLYNYDEEFRKLFKIMADFDIEMNRNEENIMKITSFIKKHIEEENLKEFSSSAIAKIIEYSSRLADDQLKLSSHLSKLVDVVYESDRWAEISGDKFVKEEHIEKTLEQIKKRNQKYEEKIMEMFESADYLIDVDGEKVGEINGLAVTGSGQYSFGKPSKITVATYKGRAGIVNIEREARTSGAIHDKGVLILTGYLGYKFAQNRPLALTATIVFEQLYSGVDGDSASSTELYAILSSLSGIPIKQGIAVTGSVNQRGIIQPIGGINEKIEGFYKVCKLKGITGKQGVMMPHQNVKNLMLSSEVIEAVKKGEFHIYAVTTIDEGIEILTGHKAGTLNKNGKFTKNSIHFLVDKKLDILAQPILKRNSDGKTK
ncbi:Lon protease family protein [Helicovermis profundi]|uniref:endopeptidase La n=1 Tax=Helicovermis profundi TaxID=3065157 RepID=A0AAU9ELZ6_9FIRM|nr:ATP-binding protein [Clostridia bacterium S502]